MHIDKKHLYFLFVICLGTLVSTSTYVNKTLFWMYFTKNTPKLFKKKKYTKLNITLSFMQLHIRKLRPLFSSVIYRASIRNTIAVPHRMTKLPKDVLNDKHLPSLPFEGRGGSENFLTSDLLY